MDANLSRTFPPEATVFACSEPYVDAREGVGGMGGERGTGPYVRI